VIALHLGEQIGAIIFVTDFDNDPVGNIAPRIIVMESRGNQKANGLLDLTRDGFALLPRDGFRSQRVEDDDSFACGDDAAVKARGRKYIITGNELS
jgi:hypothetical protein